MTPIVGAERLGKGSIPFRLWFSSEPDCSLSSLDCVLRHIPPAFSRQLEGDCQLLVDMDPCQL